MFSVRPSSAIIAAALAVFTSSVCVASPEPLTIGAISVLSGEGSSWGVNHQRGTMLAVEERNAAGGIKGRPIEILWQDSASGLAPNAVRAYEYLRTTISPVAILGPITMDELLAVAPRASRDRVVFGGSTYLADPPPSFFSVWVDSKLETDRLATFIRARYKRVAILSSTHSWESLVRERFVATFKSLGGEISSVSEPPFDSVDVRSEVARCKASKPDAVLITSYYLFAPYARALHTAQVVAPRYSIELDRAVLDSAGTGAEGVLFIAPAGATAEFIEKFRLRWKTDPDIPAASAYDAANLLFDTIIRVGLDHEALSSSLNNFKKFHGVTGLITRENGVTDVATNIYEYRNGAITALTDDQNIK